MNESTPAAQAAAAVFDPFAFEDVSTGTLRIRNPLTGAPTAMVVTLAGPEHPDRKRRLHVRQRRLRAMMAKTGKVPVSDPEDDAADQVEELIASTLGWEGGPVPFSADAARKLYSDPARRWFCDQVQAALEERELFYAHLRAELIVYAENQMRLGQRQPDGVTLRDHLQAGSAATGRTHPLLALTLPACAVGLWQAFCELARPVGMAVGQIPAAEIEAWQRLARVVLTPWEVDTLRAMDRAALAVMNEKAPKP